MSADIDHLYSVCERMAAIGEQMDRYPGWSKCEELDYLRGMYAKLMLRVTLK